MPRMLLGCLILCLPAIASAATLERAGLLQREGLPRDSAEEWTPQIAGI